MSYRVLVLPERQTMTPALLRRVKELIEAGATVIGPRPRKSPGLSGYPGCDAEVESLAEALWGDVDGERVTEHKFGRGRVIWERPTEAPPRAESGLAAAAPAPVTPDKTVCDVGAPPLSEPAQYGDFAIAASALARLGVPADFESTPPIRYAHRKDGATDIYFVVNPQNRAAAADCVFRVAGTRPELWNAVTGETRELPEFAALSGGRISVPLRFEPFESFFVVFRRSSRGAAPAGRNFPEMRDAGVITGPWEVSFDPKRRGPAKAVFPELEDWALRPEEGIKYYSGVATYTKTFDLPDANPPSKRWLDLGNVKVMAGVRLNGRDLGVVWCAPWRVEITAAVKAEGNQLEITVANLWPNRLIGDEQLPPDCEYGKDGKLVRFPGWLLKNEPRPSADRLTFSTWKQYSKDSPLLPSGLLGPVTLRASGPRPD